MKNEKFIYRKILIVGCGGAGKSTLAVEMGNKLGILVVHLDRIWWLKDWRERSREEFDALLEIELGKDSWIIDGNYNRTFARRLDKADFCIFLDYPQDLCLKSAYERFEKFKGKTRPDMADGCEEQFDPDFEKWIKSFRENVRPKMLEVLKNSHVPYEVFTSREETELWLKKYKR